MNQIKANSRQIRACASEIQRLDRTPDAKWVDYDRQWNMIKPAQEAMELATWRLERMKDSLPAQEQQSFAQIKREVGEVTSATHDLWLKLGQPTVDLSTPKLNADARGLDRASRELVKQAGTKS